MDKLAVFADALKYRFGEHAVMLTRVPTGNISQRVYVPVSVRLTLFSGETNPSGRYLKFCMEFRVFGDRVVCFLTLLGRPPTPTELSQLGRVDEALNGELTDALFYGQNTGQNIDLMRQIALAKFGIIEGSGPIHV